MCRSKHPCGSKCLKYLIYFVRLPSDRTDKKADEADRKSKQSVDRNPTQIKPQKPEKKPVEGEKKSTLEAKMSAIIENKKSAKKELINTNGHGPYLF